MDTKKKELIGNYKNSGQEWTQSGEPTEVEAYDFIDPDNGKAIPYGVYDLLIIPFSGDWPSLRELPLTEMQGSTRFHLILIAAERHLGGFLCKTEQCTGISLLFLIIRSFHINNIFHVSFPAYRQNQMI